jgi:hypothetical protein
VSADLVQMLPAQPMIVKEMRRDAEGAVSRHGTNYSF